MRDLPGAALLLPHVREAGLHRSARTGVAELEGVHARVEVRVAVVEGLHAVVGDGAERVLLHELNKVVLGVAGVLDVLRRHGREEGEALGAVERSDLLGVLGLEGVVPALKIVASNLQHVGRYDVPGDYQH